MNQKILHETMILGKPDRTARGVTQSFEDLPERIQRVATVVADTFAPRKVGVHGSYWHGHYDEDQSDLDLWVQGYRPQDERAIIDQIAEAHEIKLDVCNGDNAIKANLGIEVTYE